MKVTKNIEKKSDQRVEKSSMENARRMRVNIREKLKLVESSGFEKIVKKLVIEPTLSQNST